MDGNVDDSGLRYIDFVAAVVTGTVRDPLGRLVRNAFVTLIDSGGMQVDHNACDCCGRYWLGSDEPGSFLVIWSADRCETRAARLRLPAGTVVYDVRLYPRNC